MYRTPILLFCLSFWLVGSLSAQIKPAYSLFDGKGRKLSYRKLVQNSAQADVLMFGELHNNPIAHWLQWELTDELSRLRNLQLGAEMLESDNQQALDQYLRAEIDEVMLDSLARLWSNYETDYAPLVNLARDKGLPFIATNIPRRYASMVFRGGFEALDTLSAAEKAWIAPLPIQYDPMLPGYQKMLEMMNGHGGENLPKAQAIKDATMAYFLLKHYQAGHLFIHYNGAYHSDDHEGIVWYLAQSRPELRVLTITTVTQAQLDKLDEAYLGKADFIICVDENMTTTY